MSDYLSRIVERAGSPPMAIRPVLPSLFEPVKSPGAFAGMNPASESESVFETRNEEEPPDGTAGTAANRQPGRDRGGAVRSANTQNSEAVTPPASSDVVGTPVAGSSFREPASESRAELQSVGPALHKESVFRPQASSIGQRSEAPPNFDDAKPAFDPFAGTDPMPSPRQLAPVLSAAHVMPVTDVMNASRTRTESALSSDADSSRAPTIHITIGRVEVRAIMPAAPITPTRTRPAPQLSLDDYLRSRNGGAG